MRGLMLAAMLMAFATPARAQAQDESAAGLEGLWAVEAHYGPELRGELVITRDEAGWRGALAGVEGRAPRDGDNVRIDFPNEGGTFRGVVRSRVIEGMWRQPAGLGGQGYATPLVLHRINAREWRGDVAPLAQDITLYLRVLRDEEGRWVGAFRNPQANFNGGAPRFLVARTDDSVVFSRPGDGDAEHQRTARLLQNPERLQLNWPPLNDALELRRVSAEQGAAFFPRLPGSAPYIYRRPSDDGDGWRTARARDAGFDEAALTRFVQSIIDADPAARRPQLIHSVLAARRGRLVLEEYFYGYDRDTPHDIRSAGKTLGSIMIGAAMARGAQITPEKPIYQALADMGPFANPDPRKAHITLAHLMTHTSGLDCNENDESSVGSEDAMQTQTAQPNWWKFTLDLPMAHEPGARYAYCSGGSNLVGAVLTHAAGMPLPEFFDEALARPLQFGRYHWNLMPTGEGYLGGGAQLRPRDLLKLGQLYLDGGVWRGRRIVSREWAALSTSALVEINEQTTGMDAETFANTSTRGQDGYMWHRYGVRVGERMVEAYEANGNGGQFLIVVPQYDLAVVITGGNYMQGGIWTRWRNDIVGGQIIAAIRN